MENQNTTFGRILARLSQGWTRGPVVPVQLSESELVKRFQILLNEYSKPISTKKLTTQHLIVAIRSVNGDLDKARDILNYYLYEPSDTDIGNVEAITGNHDIEKIKNFLKHHKNVSAAASNITNGKQVSPLKQGAQVLNNPVVSKQNIQTFTQGSTTAVSLRAGHHVGIQNTGNTCFMNATLQLLYHIPQFKTAIQNFDLNNADFQNEWGIYKLEPVKALKGIFESIDEAQLLNNPSISISILLNPYFECLWRGPYKIGSVFETDEQYKKRLELYYGLFQETDYRVGETYNDRYRRVLLAKLSTLTTEEEKLVARRYMRKLKEVIDKELEFIRDARTDKNRFRDPKTDQVTGYRRQHDIGEFLRPCILDKLETKPRLINVGSDIISDTTNELISAVRCKKTVEKEVLYKKKDRYNSSFPKNTIKIRDQTITYSSDILYHKRRFHQDELENMIQVEKLSEIYYTKGPGYSGELQNMINTKKSQIFTTFSWEGTYLSVGTELLKPDLMIEKNTYSFPSEMTHLLININRNAFDLVNGQSIKVQNLAYINKYIKIESTYFECEGIGCQSGVAAGGHYFYYWKDPTNNWICFNDDITSQIREINPDSKFVDLVDGGHDTKNVCYVCVYKKVQISEATYEQYRKEANEELILIPKIELLPEIPDKPTKAQFASMLLTFEEEKRIYLESIQKMAEGDLQLPEKNWKEKRDALYYVKLLELLPKDGTKNEYRKFALLQLIDTDKDVLISYLIRSGTITEDETNNIPAMKQLVAGRKAGEISKEAEKVEKEAKEKNVAELAEEERIRIELQKATALAELQKANATKQTISAGGSESIINQFVIMQTLTLENILATYKTDSLITLVIFLQSILSTMKRDNPNYRMMNDLLLSLIRYLREKDKETNSTYIYTLLQAKKSDGTPVFQIKDFSQKVGDQTLGFLGSNYSQTIYNANKTRVKGGKRNVRKQKTRKSSSKK